MTSENKPFFGEELQLESGGTVRVRKWGWREIKRHAGLFKELITGFADAAQGLKLTAGGATDEEIMQLLAAKAGELIDAATDNTEKILIAALEHGEADLDKLHGLEDPVDVILAAARINKVVTAVGKVQAFVMQARRPAAN
jgi:hypothetical protein